MKKITFAKVKGYDEKTGVVTMLASTGSEDRHGEAVSVKAWEDSECRETYMQNPVILAGHKHGYADGTQPVIGKCMDYRPVKKGLEVDIKFAGPEHGPLGPHYDAAVRDGFLNAASIGFIPKEWDEEERDPETQELVKPRTYTKVELIEISIVPVPSNREALVNAVRGSADPKTTEFAGVLLKSLGEDEPEADEHPEPEISMIVTDEHGQRVKIAPSADGGLHVTPVEAAAVELPGIGETLDIAGLQKAVANAKASTKGLKQTFVQYESDAEDEVFRPTMDGHFHDALHGQAYRIIGTHRWPYVAFKRVEPQTDELYHFKGSVMSKVLEEIDNFWDSEDNYKALGLMQNMGVLLEGPPGTGKTCMTHLVVELMVARGDVVFITNDIGLLISGLRKFREVEPDRNVVVVLEDTDEHLGYQQQALLHLLDGADSINKVLYLATTNYLERFPPRLKRPGRFDSIVHVGPPSEAGRMAYLEPKLKKLNEDDEEIRRLAKVTDGFTFAHLRELVLSVYARGHDVEEVLKRLHSNVRLMNQQREAAEHQVRSVAQLREQSEQEPDAATLTLAAVTEMHDTLQDVRALQLNTVERIRDLPHHTAKAVEEAVQSVMERMVDQQKDTALGEGLQAALQTLRDVAQNLEKTNAQILEELRRTPAKEGDETPPPAPDESENEESGGEPDERSGLFDEVLGNLQGTKGALMGQENEEAAA